MLLLVVQGKCDSEVAVVITKVYGAGQGKKGVKQDRNHSLSPPRNSHVEVVVTWQISMKNELLYLV